MPVRASAVPMPASAFSRRASPRLDAEDIVEIRFANRGIPVLLKDVSLGGFAILTGQPMPVGTVEEFYVGVPGSPGVAVSAKAMHSHQLEQGLHLSGWMVEGEDGARVIEDAFDLLTRKTISFTA